MLILGEGGRQRPGNHRRANTLTDERPLTRLQKLQRKLQRKRTTTRPNPKAREMTKTRTRSTRTWTTTTKWKRKRKWTAPRAATASLHYTKRRVWRTLGSLPRANETALLTTISWSRSPGPADKEQMEGDFEGWLGLGERARIPLRQVCWVSSRFLSNVLLARIPARSDRSTSLLE